MILPNEYVHERLREQANAAFSLFQSAVLSLPLNENSIGLSAIDANRAWFAYGGLFRACSAVEKGLDLPPQPDPEWNYLREDITRLPVDTGSLTPRSISMFPNDSCDPLYYHPELDEFNSIFSQAVVGTTGSHYLVHYTTDGGKSLRMRHQPQRKISTTRRRLEQLQGEELCYMDLHWLTQEVARGKRFDLVLDMLEEIRFKAA